MAKSTCSIEDCDRPSNCRGWCKKHYHRWLMTGTVELRPKPSPRPCLEADCERRAHVKGRCEACYQRWRRIRPDGPRCTIDGCDRPLYGRGWCAVHYDRWRSNGDPLVARYVRGEPERRFWSNVEQAAPDACWPWTGTITHEGYGVHTVDGGQVKAHRYSYELRHGSLPADRPLDHLCHTRDESCFLADDCPHRRCVNPDHLEVVTVQENVRRRHYQEVTHCPYGHPYDLARSGPKRCLICHRERQRDYLRRKAESASRLAPDNGAP